MSLEITITNETSAVKRVAISGSLDSNTAPDLQQHIDDAIDDTILSIIVDFKNLDFISSAGLRVIFKTKKILSGRGGKLYLANLQPQIRKVFDIIKALDGMNVFKDQDEMDAYLSDMQDKVKDGEL